MQELPQLLLVKTDVLPEVFEKVMRAKMFLARGKAKNVSQAAQMADISRSAYYKYKDSVFLYDERMHDNIVTFYLSLEDRPGVLSSLLLELYRAGANIMTVNQNIPVDGVAIVSIGAHVEEQAREDILEILRLIEGVVEAKTV